MTEVNVQVGAPTTPGFYDQFADPVKQFIDEARKDGEQLAARREYDIREFGSIFDDSSTDNGPTLAAAIAEADIIANGGRIVWPWSMGGYRFDTGVEIEGIDNLEIDFGGSLVINEAVTTIGNDLIDLTDCDDFTLRRAIARSVPTGDFTGGRNPHKLWNGFGVLRRTTFEDIQASDHQNFTLAYGDVETDPLLARIEGMVFRRIRITGDCGPTGDGSGINLYPKAQNADVPASTGVLFEDIYIDVTRGSLDRAEHGPQCIKINCVDGVTFKGTIECVGADVAAINLVNGTRNVRSSARVLARRANRGMQIDVILGSTVTAVAQSMHFDQFSYRQDGIAGAGVEGYGFYNNQVPDVRFGELDSDGDVVFAHHQAAHAFKTQKFGTIVLHQADIHFITPGTPVTPMQGLDIDSIVTTGGAGTDAGRVRLGLFDHWKCDLARIGKFIGYEVDNTSMLDLYGDNCDIGPVTAVAGNPDNTGSVTCVFDRGNNNTFESIDLVSNVNVDWHYRRNADGSARILKLLGTPATARLSLAGMSTGLIEVQAPAAQNIAYGATVQINPLLGRHVIVGTLTGDITFSNPVAGNLLKGQEIVVQVTQDATGSRTVTWGTTYVVTTAVNSAANAVTIWRLIYDGTNYREMS